MTMVEAAVLFGFGVPIVAACMAFVVMGLPDAERGKRKARGAAEISGSPRGKRAAV